MTATTAATSSHTSSYTASVRAYKISGESDNVLIERAGAEPSIIVSRDVDVAFAAGALCPPQTIVVRSFDATRAFLSVEEIQHAFESYGRPVMSAAITATNRRVVPTKQALCRFAYLEYLLTELDTTIPLKTNERLPRLVKSTVARFENIGKANDARSLETIGRIVDVCCDTDTHHTAHSLSATARMLGLLLSSRATAQRNAWQAQFDLHLEALQLALAQPPAVAVAHAVPNPPTLAATLSTSRYDSSRANLVRFAFSPPATPAATSSASVTTTATTSCATKTCYEVKLLYPIKKLTLHEQSVEKIQLAPKPANAMSLGMKQRVEPPKERTQTQYYVLFVQIALSRWPM